MFLSARHAEIMQLAKDNGRVLVDDLARAVQRHAADHPQGSQRSVRSAPAQRVHGGALFPSGIENMEYEARRKIASDEKEAIGAAAARIIRTTPRSSSTSAHHGGRQQGAARPCGLMVITNNINVANRMRIYPRHRGGDRGWRGARIGRRRGGGGGRRFHPSVQGRLCRHRCVRHRPRRRAARLRLSRGEGRAGHHRQCPARHPGVGRHEVRRTAPVRIGHLSQVDTFITDRCEIASIRKICQETEVELIETNPRHDDRQNRRAISFDIRSNFEIIPPAFEDG